MSESGDRLIVTDTRTGQEILPDRERAERAEKELRLLKMKLKEMGIAEDGV